LLLVQIPHQLITLLKQLADLSIQVRLAQVPWYCQDMFVLDNTYGCSGAACTPTTGFINTTTANLTTLATTAVGATINAAIYTSGNITVNAVSTSNAIDYSVAIMSKSGDVLSMVE
jgi:hypothetical protein